MIYCSYLPDSKLQRNLHLIKPIFSPMEAAIVWLLIDIRDVWHGLPKDVLVRCPWVLPTYQQRNHPPRNGRCTAGHFGSICNLSLRIFPLLRLLPIFLMPLVWFWDLGTCEKISLRSFSQFYCNNRKPDKTPWCSANYTVNVWKKVVCYRARGGAALEVVCGKRHTFAGGLLQMATCISSRRQWKDLLGGSKSCNNSSLALPIWVNLVSN